MKRITALFLLCSLLLCFFIPVSKASPAAAIPTEVLSAALANAQEESAQDTEIRRFLTQPQTGKNGLHWMTI